MYVSEGLARFARSRNVCYLFLSVHLGVLPSQYQKAGYATGTTSRFISLISWGFSVYRCNNLRRLYVIYSNNYVFSIQGVVVS